MRKLHLSMFTFAFIFSQAVCSLGYAYLWKGQPESQNIVDTSIGNIPQKIYDDCFIKEKSTIPQVHLRKVTLDAEQMYWRDWNRSYFIPADESHPQNYRKSYSMYLCGVNIVKEEAKNRKLNSEDAQTFKDAVFERFTKAVFDSESKLTKLEPINLNKYVPRKNGKKPRPESTPNESPSSASGISQ